MLFQIMQDLLKFLIIHVDDEKYQLAMYEKIKFPKSIDELIIIIGCYSDAFSPDIIEELFTIVDLHSYKELYKIGLLDTRIIPYMTENQINIEILKADYLELSELIHIFACTLLNVNIDFEPLYFE